MTDDQTLIKLIRYIRDELDLHDLREKASDSECKMLRNQLLRNLRIHARPRRDDGADEIARRTGKSSFF